jgi:hypothetical protein
MADQEVKLQVVVEKLGEFKDRAAVADILGVAYADDGKTNVDELVEVMNEFNGAFDAAQSGVGAAYIPAASYFHLCTEEIDGQRVAVSDKKAEIVELYYNWKALGRHRNALFGAAIRFASRHLVDITRETVEIREVKIPAAEREAFANFKAQLNRDKLNAAVWAKQFPSILAMNGACLIAISHHWDAQNTKPWDAIVQSLGQGDTIPQDAYRTMFYLALHPIPLPIVEEHRSRAAEGKLAVYVNAVSIRARCTPATTGALVVTAAAYLDFKAEAFYNEVKGPLRVAMDAHAQIASTIKEDPASYCPLAVALGKERKVVDLATHKLSMIILTAYILECVKGTLALSASLRKFTGTNARAIQRWRTLFITHIQAAAGTLVEEFQLLSADH